MPEDTIVYSFNVRLHPNIIIACGDKTDNPNKRITTDFSSPKTIIVFGKKIKLPAIGIEWDGKLEIKIDHCDGAIDPKINKNNNCMIVEPNKDSPITFLVIDVASDATVTPKDPVKDATVTPKDLVKGATVTIGDPPQIGESKKRVNLI